MKNKTVGIAMSGGVDSTACALLLQEKYTLKGYFMRLDQPDFEQQLENVHSIADRLKIPLNVIDLRNEFNHTVLDYFSSQYKDGLTPNPCVICNKEIKFGLLLNHILADGNDLMGTGHYVKLEKDTDSQIKLLQGHDPRKDQSYFLCRLNQLQLKNIIFPLGGWIKKDVFSYVQEQGFTHFQGSESQDVCFLADTSVGEYLDNRMPPHSQQGNIIDIHGKILGKHKGLHHYTVGQRKGLGISDATPSYVIGLRPDTNEVIAGKNEDLFKKEIRLDNFHWISGFEPDLSKKYITRIRYTHRGATCQLVQHSDDSFTAVFDEAQRAITPGQFGVVYHDNELIGSGVIR